GRLRTVREDMPKMRFTEPAFDFAAKDSEGQITLLVHILWSDRRPEAGPTRSRIKFVDGAEERTVTIDATVQAGAVLINNPSGERPLGGGAPRDVVLQGRQLLLPILLRFADPGQGLDTACRAVGRKPGDLDRAGIVFWRGFVGKSGETEA